MARYTPEFLAAIKRRYEDTDQPMPAIAGQFDIGLRTLQRMAQHGRWRRRVDRPPRGLTPAMLSVEKSEDLLRRAEALAREHHERLRSQRDTAVAELPATKKPA